MWDICNMEKLAACSGWHSVLWWNSEQGVSVFFCLQHKSWVKSYNRVEMVWNWHRLKPPVGISASLPVCQSNKLWLMVSTSCPRWLSIRNTVPGGSGKHSTCWTEKDGTSFGYPPNPVLNLPSVVFLQIQPRPI